MLPQSRSNEYLSLVPTFELNLQDVEPFMNELRCYHDRFREGFKRKETSMNVFRYMVGLLSPLERKSVEPMALYVKDGHVRPMQLAISDAVWNDDIVLSIHHKMVADNMNDPNGVLLFDESGFVKKGKDSAGVSSQYCGTIGKVENCQVGVFAGYASPRGYTFLDKRLFLPEKWLTEKYKERREKCKIPDNQKFKTKPQLAAEMLNAIHNEGILTYKYVATDNLYGQSPDFIAEVERHVGKIYFVATACNTLCWLKEPVLADDSPKATTVKKIAAGINNVFWYKRTVSEGTKGPIIYEFSKKRIILAKNGLPWKHVWLIMKRTLGDNPEYSFYISNAGRSTRLKTFVWLSGVRWAIEQCFEEAKSELGLDHYEVRKFPGWNHHVMICMLTHLFLWYLKVKHQKKSTSNYAITAKDFVNCDFAST